MSWSAYTDNLTNSQRFDSAALFGADGGSVWASTAGFKIKPEEVKKLSQAFSNAKIRDGLWGEGIYINGKKFVTIKADDKSIYAKSGQEGICVCKTVQAMLLGHYPSGIQPGDAANTIEKLAEYLVKSNY